MSDDSESVNRAIRLSWVAVAALFALFVLAPYAYLFSQTSWIENKYDPRLNLIELLAIAGSASTLAFVFIAFRFAAKRKQSQTVSSASMERALFIGLVVTGGYWLLFLVLSTTGSDSDGIMRGWMVIIFPPAIVAYVLHLARRP